jgi:hypothetical protein
MDCLGDSTVLCCCQALNEAIILSLNLPYLCSMEKDQNIKKPLNSNGAAIFGKILEDKKAIHLHIINGGKLIDLKDKYQFLDPLSIYQPQ